MDIVVETQSTQTSPSELHEPVVPLPLVVAGFCLLFWLQTPVAFVLVMIGAPTVGMLALACVWGLYTKAQAGAPSKQLAENG